MKYEAESFRGVRPIKRAKKPLRKIARKQERRAAKKACKSIDD